MWVWSRQAVSDSPEKPSRHQGMALAQGDPYGASADPFGAVMPFASGGELPSSLGLVPDNLPLQKFMVPADVGFVWQGRSRPPAQGRVVVDSTI
jgi:hypothetical protein